MSLRTGLAPVEPEEGLFGSRNRCLHQEPYPRLRPVLGERRGLATTRPTCLVQLPFQALHLLPQAVILPLQAVALALQPALLATQVLGVALPPRQLSAKPFEVGGKFRSPMWG